MKLLGTIIALLTYIITIVLDYHAWVDGDYLCQVILWMFVPLAIIGLCLPDTPANMAAKVGNVFFWIFSGMTIPVQCWIWFGGHSNIGFFYGLLSLTVTIVGLLLAAVHITNKQ
jgi:hypothetical protein